MNTLKANSKLNTFLIIAMVIGLASFGAVYAANPTRAWHGFIMNYFFFVCLGIGGSFFTAVQHLTSAGWSATVRRIPEAFYSWLPAAIILMIPIFLGGRNIYEWTHPDVVAADHLLKMKTAYLNIPFFLIRTVVFFAIWFLLGGAMVRNSLKQDSVGGAALTHKNTKLSAIFMPLFALSFSFLSFDLIMSLDPHWFSTMFGVNAFANMFLSTIAVIIVVVVNMKRAGYFKDSINDQHIGNLGLLLFAFTVFYAYIVFCQFMLIWYGNLPEETSYYLKRYENGWSCVAYIVVFGKFVIPFLALLPYAAKRNMNYLVKVAYWVIIACWIDIFWMVMPNYSKTPFVPVFEAGIFVGFVGLFGFLLTKFLSKNPIEPQKDPRLHEALHLH